MRALLQSSSAVEVKISKFNPHVREVRKKVHEAVNILPKKKDRLAILEPNPRVPRLFGLQKLHNAGTSMRPVISTISSPTYKLAAYLSDWFKFKPGKGVKNSVDLVEKLGREERRLGHCITNGVLLSFDVVGLYPNIPLKQTVQYTRTLLLNVNTPEQIIEDFMSLLGVCLETNICGFDGEFFKFPEDIGVPMGSPLSPPMGEIFMDYLEQEIFDVGNPCDVLV